jgi:hypothetical protein
LQQGGYDYGCGFAAALQAAVPAGQPEFLPFACGAAVRLPPVGAALLKPVAHCQCPAGHHASLLQLEQMP